MVEQREIVEPKLPGDAVQQGAKVPVPGAKPRPCFELIDEARMARRPLLCSNIGGMKEKVVDRQIGLSFLAGSGADLARRIQECTRTDALWQSLRANIRPPTTVRQVVDELERFF